MLGSACVLESLGSDGTLDQRRAERWKYSDASDAVTDADAERWPYIF